MKIKLPIMSETFRPNVSRKKPLTNGKAENMQPSAKTDTMKPEVALSISDPGSSQSTK
eukprot:CAMPEP_0115758414 /NCGR_PEP_ID=MMETSP0272-20121206/98938_1 /TAXON_ID=71861 /ORGANISM="Scrippsiella trochoidea, Strain CCMP3099" /LENGTH=57 /DNA_ID=CAMNT_0003203981 /DNA_START=318 /DNA_END=491 /DNA_ORIENTATION=+